MSPSTFTTGLRARLLFAVGVPLLLAVCAGVAVFFALRIARSGQLEVRETGERLETSQHLLQLVLDAEDGQRGFALTGQRSELVPFDDATRDWPVLIRSLQEGFAEDPEQLARVRRIDELFGTWLAQIARPVIAGRKELPPSHLEAVRDLRSGLLTLLDQRRRGGQEGAEQRVELLAGLTSAVERARTAPLQGRLAHLWAEVDHRLMAYRTLAEGHFSPRAEEAAIGELLQQTVLASEVSIAGERAALAPIISGAGEELIDWIRKLQAELARTEHQRLEASLARESRRGRLASWAAIGSLALALALGLVSALVLAGRLLVSLRSVGRAAEKLAAGDLRQRVKEVEGDDIGRLARSFNQMADRIAARDREVALLHDMGQLLQSANDENEAFRVVARLVPALVPGASGAIFTLSNSRDELVRRLVFGGPEQEVPERVSPERCAPTSCWGLRKGQTYFVLDPGRQVICEHLPTPAWPYICVPLSAQGQTLGLLFLESAPGQGDDHLSSVLGLLPTVASEVALALGNLALRAELRAQSVRDPLTGLFNRRYLEETLAREIDRARRKKLALSAAMTDLDLFKNLNDTWGHEAGDLVLRMFSNLLRAHFRTQDVLCRYGGEEFALVFPDCTTEQARARAEDFLAALRTSEVQVGDSTIRGITASIGIAGFPRHGATPEELLRNADYALYEAKRAGRDRVHVAAGTGVSSYGEDTGFT